MGPTGYVSHVATTTRHLDAPPEQVWAVLADAHRYAEWVVGASTIRGVEGDWPQPGARFHHKVGVWPLRIRDDTTVVDCDPPRRLVLEARVRPFGVARIELLLQAEGAGTTVSMIEVPTAPFVARWATPLLDPLTDRRNAEALRRLATAAGGQS